MGDGKWILFSCCCEVPSKALSAVTVPFLRGSRGEGTCNSNTLIFYSSSFSLNVKFGVFLWGKFSYLCKLSLWKHTRAWEGMAAISMQRKAFLMSFSAEHIF